MMRSFHVADVFTRANGGGGTAAIWLALARGRDAARIRAYAAGARRVGALVFRVGG